MIDDGSKDDTLTVARSFAEKDSRVRVYHQENAGVSVARNHGIREAKGEYLVFLDSDDWLEDDAVEVLLDAQMKYPDKVICANSWWDVRIEGNRLLVWPRSSRNEPSRFVDMKYIAESYCFFPGVITGFHNANAKLFRASFGITFPEGIRWGEDAVFFTSYLCKNNEAYYISRPLVNVLDRHESATRSSYVPEYLNSLVKEYQVIADLVKHDEEIGELMLISRGVYIWNECLKKSATEHVSNTEIRRIQEAIRPSARYMLKCKRFSMKLRARFFLDIYFPAPFVKALETVCKLIDDRRKKRRLASSMEIIENWKDFPSQP